MQKIFPKGGVA